MIKHFTDSGHEVTVATLVRSDIELQEGLGLADHCHKYVYGHCSKPLATTRMIMRLPTLVPSTMGYFYSRALRSQVDRLLREVRYDLIFVHCSSVAPYVQHVVGVPKILDFGDMDSQKWLAYSGFKPFPFSMGYGIEGRKLERAEKRLAAKFDLCSCTTKAELDTLNSYNLDVPTTWFPNGVDANFFHASGEDYDRDLIVFVGRMDYYPNQEGVFFFCDQVLPMIQDRRSSTRLQIVGADPPQDIRYLSERTGVSVTGSVPDVRPFVQKAALTVAPLRIARGTQNKILESMAMGVPVVASVAAAGGVDAISEDHFLTATKAEAYCDAILRILGDERERSRLSNAARERVLTHHSWSESMRKLDEIVADCVDNFDPTVATPQVSR